MFLKNSRYFGYEREVVVDASFHYIMRGMSKVSGFPVNGKFKIEGEKVSFTVKMPGDEPLKRYVDIDIEMAKAVMSGAYHAEAWFVCTNSLEQPHEWEMLLSIASSKDDAEEGLGDQMLQAFLKAEGIGTDSQFKPVADRFIDDLHISQDRIT